MADDSQTLAAETLLREVTQAVAPLVRLLVRRGIDHPRFSAALKRAFVDAALAELEGDSGAMPTITAIGLRSGLQRRDVKQQLAHPTSALPPKALSPTLPMQLLARWASDAATTDADGTPLPLPIRAGNTPVPSVQALAESLSKDVHPQALLDELVRLGLARTEAGTAHLLSESFVPTREFGQLLGALSRNLRAHASAAVENVLAGESKFLEYSLVADELRPDSAEALHALARKFWRSAYKRSVVEAGELIERDKALGFGSDAPETRVRFGVYFHSEPVLRPPPATIDPGADPP
ncbi:MAG: hypothetical protein AD742_14215 [Methylibium sp. NZG]|nr:MAG: hypothetical protein AD742_14215 [Methylibium sp. NZG]